MTIKSSGQLQTADLATEFGGTKPYTMSGYYSGGARVPAGAKGLNGSIPAAGSIKLSDFYGAPKVADSWVMYKALNYYTPGSGSLVNIGSDSLGNIYAVASVYDSDNYHFAVWKYDKDGNFIWNSKRVMVNIYSLRNVGIAIYGNTVCVTSDCYSSGWYTVCVKINATTGNIEWQKLYAMLDVRAAVDPSENIYVVGPTNIIKLGPTGSQLWMKTLPRVPTTDIYTYKYEIKKVIPYNGGVLAFGSYNNGNAYTTNNFQIFISSAGVVSTYDSTRFDVPNSAYFGSSVVDAVIDSSGNRYVVHELTTDGYATMVGVVKYDSTGATVWSKVFKQNGGSQDPASIAVDSSSNVYVFGAVSGYNTYQVGFVLSLDSQGNIKKTQVVSGPDLDTSNMRLVGTVIGDNLYFVNDTEFCAFSFSKFSLDGNDTGTYGPISCAAGATLEYNLTSSRLTHGPFSSATYNLSSTTNTIAVQNFSAPSLVKYTKG